MAIAAFQREKKKILRKIKKKKTAAMSLSGSK